MNKGGRDLEDRPQARHVQQKVPVISVFSLGFDLFAALAVTLALSAAPTSDFRGSGPC